MSQHIYHKLCTFHEDNNEFDCQVYELDLDIESNIPHSQYIVRGKIEFLDGHVFLQDYDTKNSATSIL